MRIVMQRQIKEAMEPAFYDYIQEVTGKERLHRYAMVETVAVNAVRDMIDQWIDAENVSHYAFMTDEEACMHRALQEKVGGRIKTYKKQRFENPGRRCPFSKVS